MFIYILPGIGNQIREKEHDTPCQHMEYKIKIPVLNYFHHLATHEDFQLLPTHIKLIDLIAGIEKELENISHDSSNLDEHLQTAIEGAAKLVNVWELLDYTESQRLQYLVFPKGGIYGRKNDGSNPGSKFYLSPDRPSDGQHRAK